MNVLASARRIARRWLTAQSPLRVGVVGYTDDWGEWSFDRGRARAILRVELGRVAEANRGRTIEVVTGLTDMGIPKIAYEVAAEYGMICVGLASWKALNNPQVHVDKIILEGADWGDESETFLDYIDQLIKVGGGPQSEAEFKAFTGPKIEFPLERR